MQNNMMIGVRSPFDDQYDGSRLFVSLADLCGLSVDLINFLICQISGLFLASLFRSLLHPSRASIASRHAFGLSLGLCFGYFCFGQQAIHIAGLPALCYIVMRTQSPYVVQRYVMVVAIGYLSGVHMYRMYYDYGSATIDITGPLMMITQKVTTLAFSLHDGHSRDPATLSQSQRFHAVRRMPSLLEYFAFCLHFQGLLAGPIVLFKDYVAFIEGTNLRQHYAMVGGTTDVDGLSACYSGGAGGGGQPLLGGEIVREPSPTRTVVQKMLGSVLCAFVFIKFSKVYPIKNIKDAEFVDATGFAGKLWFLMNATMCVRFKYYHAWLMGDAICNNSGLGFNGYDAAGGERWDLCSNIDILGFEFATNFRDGINSWNLATNRWLRDVVYDRVPKRYATVLTFGLSALWHGFYPGYYMTFASGALMVMAARIARKHVRHRFQRSSSTRQLYDIFTLMVTRVCMAYATFPFVLLEFKASLSLYLSVYMCLHLITAMSIVAIPRLLQGAPTENTNGSSGRKRHDLHSNANTKAYNNTKHCDISSSISCSSVAKPRRLIAAVDGKEPTKTEAANTVDVRHVLIRHVEHQHNHHHHLQQQQQQQQQQTPQRGRHFVAGNGNGAFMSTNMSNSQF